MNQSFYIGATAAHQQNQRMNIQGNNIANVNSYGFRAEQGRFTALMYQNIKAAEERELPTGTGGAMWLSNTKFTPGTVMDTGREYDYMIMGDGFFAVADLAKDEVTITRKGSFCKARLARPTGEMDENGLPVMEEGWYLSDGQGRFILSDTGTVIEIPEGEGGKNLPVGVFNYANLNGIEHIDGTRFRAIAKNGGIQRGTGQVENGKLEGSNVDLAEEISKVIESQRAYSMALKLVLTSDEIETTINGLRG